MSDAIIVAIITGGLSLIGVIVSNIHTAQSMDAKLDKQQAVTETKLEELTRESGHTTISPSASRCLKSR